MYELIRLIRCPFCADHRQSAGDVFADPQAVCQLHSQGTDSESEPDGRVQLLRYNSPLPDVGPCPHLVCITALFQRHEPDAARRFQIEWESDLSWFNPLFDKCDQDGLGRDLLFHFIAGFEEQALLPETPHHIEEFEAFWPDLRDTGNRKPLFDARGLAVFADPVPEYIAALQRRQAELHEAVAGKPA